MDGNGCCLKVINIVGLKIYLKFIQNEEELNEENEGVKNCRETDRGLSETDWEYEKECHFLSGFEWTA